MSSPEDALDGRNPKPGSSSSSSSSDDSMTGNENDSSFSVDLDKSGYNMGGQMDYHYNNNNNNNSVENESELSHQSGTMLNHQQNGGTASGRKGKKRKIKQTIQRRDSKEDALVGWNGSFPNLSSTHSLESNSDLDQQKVMMLKKQIYAATRFRAPAAAAALAATAFAIGDGSNAPVVSGSSKKSRKRGISSSDGQNNPKRAKGSEEESGGGRNLRMRSKSLAESGMALQPRLTRARSLCASSFNQAMAEAKEEPPTSAPKATTRRRSTATVKRLPTDEFYTLPFKYGWKRELVYRSNSTVSRQRGDVIFISPDGRKLRSREDIAQLLTGDLTIENFCFQRQIQHVGEQFETVRYARPAPARRKSQANVKQQQPQQQHQPQQQQQQQEQQQMQPLVSNTNNLKVPSVLTPVSGKRIPKPKVPKGASPPPEGWTSTMAVKGNARVLAASNGNASGGAGSSANNSARKRGRQQSKQSAKAVAEQPASSKLILQPPGAEQLICLICHQLIHEKQLSFPISANSNSLICMNCFKNGRNAAKAQLEGRGQANGTKKQQEGVDENTNGNAKVRGHAMEANNVKNANGVGNDDLLVIGGDIELPGALPPDQLLSDEQPSRRAGNKITPKPLEIVVINGRKALAVAGEPPRPRLQVIPREPDMDIYEKHYPKRSTTVKEKRQNFVDCISAGNLSCQVISAVMKTMDLHDRVRMSNVCKTWAMVGRDRSVWRTLKLRDTRITNWVFLLRDMARYRTRELDMMGVKLDNPKMRLEGDLRVLKWLRVLRTDPSEAEFIQTIIKRIPRLLELRTTCTSRVLSLVNIDRMVDMRVLRIRMVEPKAGIVSLQPLQALEHLRELSLRGINNMAQLELSQLQSLQQLETLVLGSCRGMKVSTFGYQVLPNLKRLRHLRLENHHSNRSFNINEIMDGLARGASVKRLELINVNVDAELSNQLTKCESLQELLLMPNFHNNTAYMMHYIMQAINENSEQLTIFRLGLTYELLSVTRALALNHEKDCIPVALPIPGVPDNDVLNESDDSIAYLPVDRLESILHHMMPQAWLTVAKVSQSETINLKFLPASTETVAASTI